LVTELSEANFFAHILVVNDGSAESSNWVFEKLKEFPNLTVIAHAVNRGKGQALKTGLNHYLLNSPPESVGVVSCDADGQHLPMDIINVATQGAEKDCFTLGARYFGKNVPWRSKAGNLSTRFFFALFTGHFISDTQTGLRYFPRRQIPFFIRVPHDRFDYEFAALVDAVAELRDKVREVPIKTVYIEGNASSHYRSFRDSLTVMGVFLRFISLSFASAIIDFLAFILFFHFLKDLLLSFVLARVISVAFNFHYARSWVFKAKSQFVVQLAKYLGLVAFLLATSYCLTYLLATHAGTSPIVAKAIVETALFFVSFIVQKRFILVKKRSEIS
jgi:glycosyltransferase involved in cell wall biosynthesis